MLYDPLDVVRQLQKLTEKDKKLAGAFAEKVYEQKLINDGYSYLQIPREATVWEAREFDNQMPPMSFRKSTKDEDIKEHKDYIVRDQDGRLYSVDEKAVHFIFDQYSSVMNSVVIEFERRWRKEGETNTGSISGSQDFVDLHVFEDDKLLVARFKRVDLEAWAIEKRQNPPAWSTNPAFNKGNIQFYKVQEMYDRSQIMWVRFEDLVRDLDYETIDVSDEYIEVYTKYEKKGQSYLDDCNVGV